LPQSSHIGLDGITRNKTEEDKISLNFGHLFSQPTGQEVIKYLRSITIEMVSGPNITTDELRHLEGQRYLVGLIERHIQRSHKVKNNE
tara:strand:+ start:521 stop:784 length:264 start_codon:yes stop_codon:yes gene_type:complete